MFRHRSPRPDPAEVDEIIDRNVALARVLDHDHQQRLLALTAELVTTKRWESIEGFSLTDEMIVTVAANAAIPVLALDTRLYRGVRSVIIRPGQYRSRGTRSGPVPGVVSESDHPIVGQATPNAGPVSISWPEAARESRHPHAGRNVVVHEFAHKIDMSDGYGDGTPPMSDDDARAWGEIVADELERTSTRDGDAVLRPYAWTNRMEFFAVATETFFCTPLELRSAKPALYDALKGFYRQDPAERAAPGRPGG